MAIDDNPTYYDVLDLKPDASPQEVREAYLRTKSTYNKDSVALYTLVSADEREDMLHKVEQAYEILSNAEKRREYDRHHGLLGPEEAMLPPSRPPRNKKIVSIDRVPPMDSSLEGEDLLIAPTTDFTGASEPGSSLFDSSEAPLPSSSTSNSSSSGSAVQPPPLPASVGRTQPPRSAEMQVEIAEQTEWHGNFIRKVREARRVSIEEMAAVTKITKSYIVAIEEENFTKLPAAVYLRGFIIQIAKVLKLPHEKVAGGYMARYYQARPDQH
jgi:curved DNA-binding protein CbpA